MHKLTFLAGAFLGAALILAAAAVAIDEMYRLTRGGLSRALWKE